MMYPFLTLDDETEIVHSELLPNGRVKVYIERPDKENCFSSASCYLPEYQWIDISGFTADDIAHYQEIIESCA